MTEIGNQYERFLADFGEQLHQAEKRRAGRTHSRRRVRRAPSRSGSSRPA